MSTEPQLSDLQLAIMRILWDRREATAAQVHAALSEQDRDLAPTTVATLLTRLEKRALLGHRTKGRQYVYRAVVTEQEVRQSMMSRVTDFFFGGNPAALVSHMVGAQEIGPADLEQIKALIAQRESEDTDHG